MTTKHKYFCLITAALITGALGGCAQDRFDGGAVPTRADAIGIASQLCLDPFRQRKGQWRVVLRGGIWKVSRDAGKQSILIDARSGKTDGCRSI